MTTEAQLSIINQSLKPPTDTGQFHSIQIDPQTTEKLDVAS